MQQFENTAFARICDDGARYVAQKADGLVEI